MTYSEQDMTYSGILFQIFLAVGCLDVVVYIRIVYQRQTFNLFLCELIINCVFTSIFF